MSLTLLKPQEQQDEEYRQERLVKMIEDTLALAKQGKFSDVMIVAKYLKTEPDGSTERFCVSPTFNRLEIVGWLELLKLEQIQAAKDA